MDTSGMTVHWICCLYPWIFISNHCTTWNFWNDWKTYCVMDGSDMLVNVKLEKWILLTERCLQFSNFLISNFHDLTRQFYRNLFSYKFTHAIHCKRLSLDDIREYISGIRSEKRAFSQLDTTIALVFLYTYTLIFMNIET